MTKLAKGSFVIAVVLLSAGSALGADSIRHTPSYRPYITEVGPPRPIDGHRLMQEMQFNSDLRSWVNNYGYPDVAEIQDVVPEYGWSDYEIRIFYVDRDQELAFGRIAFFPRHGDPSFMDDYGLIKYQGALQPENFKRIQSEIHVCGASSGTAVDRIIASAERAERAAESAERSSELAQEAATRAETAVNGMEAGFKKSLRK